MATQTVVEESSLKEEFLTLNLSPFLRAICLVSWALPFFPPSSAALLLGYLEDGEGVG